MRTVWILSTEESVKQHAQRVDVARCRNRLSADLLWTGIVGRKQLGGSERTESGLGGNDGRDSKIEQLGYALGCYQDVVWLNVAMDH